MSHRFRDSLKRFDFSDFFGIAGHTTNNRQKQEINPKFYNKRKYILSLKNLIIPVQ